MASSPVATAGVAARPPAPAPAPSGTGRGRRRLRGQTVCTVTDTRLQEIPGWSPSTTATWRSTTATPTRPRCASSGSTTSARSPATRSTRPTRCDPEDLAIASDGTVWVADIGDNDWPSAPPSRCGSSRRGEKQPVIHRVTYPDGAARRRGAADRRRRHADHRHQGGRQAGRHLRAGGRARRQQPERACRCKRVGEFTLPPSRDRQPARPVRPARWSPAGPPRRTASGWCCARTPTRSSGTCPDGDVVKAITSGKPRVTPLPNEPQGEAITYSAGRQVVPDGVRRDAPARSTPLLRYAPAAAPPAAPARRRPAAPAATSAGSRRPDARRHHVPGGRRRPARSAARGRSV